ncbi:MAG: AAA family ATPase, partial [Desulfovibrio sp.]|nr:AAA family ATPase [Desulfovibrio sp.]
GPGTGKTTVINAIIRLFRQKKGRILLSAPTGRAARRMTETSGLEARTIHRLLEYSPTEDGFARNEDNPLACGLLVVDEASMLDAMLMFHLLKAVPLGATLVLVGDVNQLPSVGPGNVLKDLIQSGAAPVVELTEVFRQAAASEIIVGAHRINRGELPSLTPPAQGLSDFYFIRQEDPEKAADLVVELVRDHIPRRFGLHPVDDIQVLTPMHKGAAGVTSLNSRLQDVLNAGKPEISRGERRFRLDDKVMQIRNNYEKDVFNGDIGRVCLLQAEDRELTVRFYDRNVIYSFEELDEIVPAYAISVHKSQGSEYPAVVLPLLTQHYVLLQRNLVYTGVTRGRRLVILVGSVRALQIAVRNNKTQARHTWLARRLREGQGRGKPLRELGPPQRDWPPG